MCLCVYVCVHTSSVADLWCLENSLLESIHIYLFWGVRWIEERLYFILHFTGHQGKQSKSSRQGSVSKN